MCRESRCPVRPRLITEERTDVVRWLDEQGKSTAEIADILRVSPSTVQRMKRSL
ncbi:helix-turn-helix domain-containing protein [Corynebacterium sp. HMSC064E10]|uniref:helix-turn-helix domain-containing protein n=1 Tax=Corynebacterium sp. HMSC064E10 TaxID=1739364 RepID=UPI0009F6D9D1